MSRRPYFSSHGVTLYAGDAAQVLADLPEESVDCVVTSPPYWGLRYYGMPGQYGHEPTIDAYVGNLRRVFRQTRRVLASDGTLWLNLGDTYGGSWNNYVAPGSTAATASDLRRGRNGRHRPPQAGYPRKSLLGVPWRVVLALTGTAGSCGTRLCGTSRMGHPRVPGTGSRAATSCCFYWRARPATGSTSTRARRSNRRC